MVSQPSQHALQSQQPSQPDQPVCQQPPTPPPTPLNAPPATAPRRYNLKILQLNCNGIQNKLQQILDFLIKEDIKIAALQETKLSKQSTNPNTGCFTLVRRDREGKGGGGLAFLVHNTLNFQQVPEPIPDSHLESQTIKIDNVHITNLYIPPASSCTTPGYAPTIRHFLQQKDAIILGDINGHDDLWHSPLSDTRGSLLAEEIGASDFGVLNEDLPTRLPLNQDGQPTSPDISLASLALLPYTSWETKTQLSSDHLPIIVTVQTDIKPTTSEDKTYLNFRKADWTKFYVETERIFETLDTPSDVHKGEKAFRKIINKISKTSIPSGRIKSVLPGIPTEAAQKMTERDNLRANDPTADRIKTLNAEIDKIITDEKREKWRNTVEDINAKTDSAKLFKLIKHLNGGTKESKNEAIKFKGKYVSKPKQIANKFNKQYSSVVRHVSSKTARRVTKDSKLYNLNDNQTFTPDKTREAIKTAKASKALGPDGISTVHLKNLGPHGIKYLTDIFNISLNTSNIPDIWKTSKIIPLLKPNKPSDDSGSYRPVSLLCPGIKILERLILPTLKENLPVPDIQHGFRSQHSTVTALNDFTQHVAGGFNQRKPADRTLLLQLDLSKAFDMVSHEKLMKDLNQSTLPGHLKRWFNCYLHGRQSKVLFRNELSDSRNVRAGVPQGAVTSPILFNFYIANLPTIPPGIKMVQYADDMSVYVCGNNIKSMSNQITQFAKSLTEFLAERELMVSPEKSTVTLFTPATAKANIKPVVEVQETEVKLDKNPKLLGVTYDTMFTFSQHIKNTVAKCKKKLNILKALAGSTWGQDKETLIITYKSIIRSTLEYANPIWSPMISASNWERLQSIQNKALRIATGSLSMAAIDHLHRECKVLPVKQHCELVTKQFLASCHIPGHPGGKHLGNPPPPRDMKKTMLIHEQEVRNTFDPTLPKNDKTLKKAMKDIHTRSVRSTLQSYPNNKVLNDIPPDIAVQEKDLPRKTRCELSRLRSGYSRNLNSYLSRINPEVQDVCPRCGVSPHNTNHLFNCSMNPTQLQTIDLWTRPYHAANFLNIDNDDEV